MYFASKTYLRGLVIVSLWPWHVPVLAESGATVSACDSKKSDSLYDEMIMLLQLDLVMGRQEVQHARGDHVRQAVAPTGIVNKKPTFTAIPSFLVILFYLCFYGVLFCLIIHLLAVFTRYVATAGNDKSHWNFEDYLLYRFAYFIVWTYGAKSMLLLCTGCILLFLGSVFYCASIGDSLVDATYNVFNMLIDPSAARDQPTLAGRSIGAVVSIAGLFFFALLLTLTQDAFNSYLQRFQTGETPIVEANHVVIVGFTGNTTKILDELCHYYAPQQGTRIVLLADESASKVEGAIREADINRRGSKIIVRKGHPKNLSDLRAVSADTCATIVLDGVPGGAGTREMRDNFVLQALVSLQGVGWPINGHILALCSLEQNQATFKKIGGPKTSVLYLDAFMGKLMVRSSRTAGLCQVMSSLFGYTGSEFYLYPVPESSFGKSFTCANRDFPNAIVAGVMSKTGETILCPGPEHDLSEGETFILLAEDEAALAPSKEPLSIPEVSRRRASRRSMMSRVNSVQHRDQVVIIGWNRELIPSVIYELDHFLIAGSEVTILAMNSVEERQAYIEILQRRKGNNFKHIETINQKWGSLEVGLRTSEITKLIEDATRVFILSDISTAVSISDAHVLAAILAIREILASAGKQHMIPIVPELRDMSSARLCRDINAFDFLQTSVIPAQIISSVAVQPKIAPVLLTLLSSNDAQIDASPIGNYFSGLLDGDISFWEATNLVSQSGDVLIGWTQDKNIEADPGSLKHRVCSSALELLPETQWVINPPDKMTKRSWSAETDLLLVINWKTRFQGPSSDSELEEH